LSDAAPPSLTWYRAEFTLDAATLAGDADYRIDTSGMGKGSIFVNGHGIGRFWLIPGGSTGQPSQRFYHVPRNWLAGHNVVVLFEEQSKSPAQLTLERRVATSSPGSLA